MNLHELLRRLQAGESRNAISRLLKMSVNTVGQYRRWAQEQGLLAGPLPDLTALEKLRQATFRAEHTPRQPNQSSLEPYRAEVTAWLEVGHKPRTIWRLLQKHHAPLTTSQSAVWRLVQSIRAQQPPPPGVMRIETAPGEVAQVDFGFMGYLSDPQTGQRRKVWVFAMVLGWSRHMYAELVFDQKLATWLLCHQRAFEFFNGVPQRVVIDNLKTAIIRAYTLDQDPIVQQSYRECAEHYGFLIDPCLPRRPEHKGKVERGGVAYLQQSFWPLLEGELTLSQANQQLREWLTTTAGLRVHGTTQTVPLVRFEQTEQAILQRLPTTAYDPAVWKACQLHRDGHVTFEKAYYSAPHRYLGQTLWLRAGLKNVRLFTDHFECVATHSRASEPGQRFTQSDHLPLAHAQALLCTRATCLAQAEAIGPATQQIIAELLASRPVDRFRTVLRILRLADIFTPARLEQACALGLASGDASYVTLKRLLHAGLETQALAIPLSPPPEELIFARTPAELAEAILGGAAWN